MAEIETVIKPPAPLPTSSLVLRRLAALVFMLCLLGAAIAVRLLVPVPHYDVINDENMGGGGVSNETTLTQSGLMDGITPSALRLFGCLSYGEDVANC